MRRLLPILILVLFSASAALADDARAQQILKQARQAIGGEEQLQKIQGLQVKGQYRRAFGDRQMGGDREISILLPNKYLVEDAMNSGGLSTAMINTRGLNGDKAWSGNSGGGGMFIRMMGPGGQQASPEQMEEMQRRIFSAEFSRYLLAMILTPPPALAVEYKYAGESEVEDAQADVIDVSGPDNFTVRVFFDKQSHIPLLLSYRGPKPRIMTMQRPSRNGATPDDIRKAREEAEKRMSSENPPVPEEVDFFIRLTDHKKVGGLTLPHKLTFLTETEVSEEFEISKYQVNPQFKADLFEKH
ncbi:MAG TPA: hypothetical protein VJ751_02645 [Pyrinomonadaceae bacterium]|nr:hypothetical protein [Pyrinomonadaceae bacterium]